MQNFENAHLCIFWFCMFVHIFCIWFMHMFFFIYESEPNSRLRGEGHNQTCLVSFRRRVQNWGIFDCVSCWCLFTVQAAASTAPFHRASNTRFWIMHALSESPEFKSLLAWLTAQASHRDGRPPTPRLGRLGVSSHSFIWILANTTLMSHDIARPSCCRAAGFCLRAPVTVYHDSPSTFPIKNVKLLVTVKRNAGISSWSF